MLRTVIAKAIGGDCKPDDLMTAGSIAFEKIEFQFGVSEPTEDASKMLDLTKALKRVNKDQHLGIAWKGKKIVVSVRLRKPFLLTDLKELRSQLPKNASRTNMLVVGEFVAFSKTKVAVNFKEGTKNLVLVKSFSSVDHFYDALMGFSEHTSGEIRFDQNLLLATNHALGEVVAIESGGAGKNLSVKPARPILRILEAPGPEPTLRVRMLGWRVADGHDLEPLAQPVENDMPSWWILMTWLK